MLCQRSYELYINDDQANLMSLLFSLTCWDGINERAHLRHGVGGFVREDGSDQLVPDVFHRHRVWMDHIRLIKSIVSVIFLNVQLNHISGFISRARETFKDYDRIEG